MPPNPPAAPLGTSLSSSSSRPSSSSSVTATAAATKQLTSSLLTSPSAPPYQTTTATTNITTKYQKSPTIDKYNFSNPDLSGLSRSKLTKPAARAAVGIASGVANSSNIFNDEDTTPSLSRPPVPPQSQTRVRKQNKLISKKRALSPNSGGGGGGVSNGYGVGGLSKSNYDSDDGLRLLHSNGKSKEEQQKQQSAPVEISLKLPINKIDMTSIASNGHSSGGSSSSTTSINRSTFRQTTTTTTTTTASSPSRSSSPALSLRSNNSSLGRSVSGSGGGGGVGVGVGGRTMRSLSLNQSALQSTPRRVFPQTYTRGDPLDLIELRSLESSPVVFDANLSFVFGCKKQPVRQSFHPTPSHLDPQTSSAYLTEKIQNFLRRTDHVNEEWAALGRRSSRRRYGSVGPSSGRATPTSSLSSSVSGGGGTGGYDVFDTISLIERQRERSSERRSSCGSGGGSGSLGRSRSTQNILIKGYQLSKTLPRTPTSRSSSIARDFSETDDDDRTIREEDDDNELGELSEMTVDLTEERSTSTIASERLEAETAERLKLEKELHEQQTKVKNLQETSEKLEMELICAKSDLNGISEDEDPENEDNNLGGVYKLKYERVARELEFTKRRLQTQHEHDLEQLVGLKKQLEKKLSDAYEEVEEQRQVVGQWKRKAQKMTNEMNDLRMLLEEQNGRNNLLEKKQRKFDSELQSLQDGVRQERQAKDRLSREKDVLISEKFTLEQSLADTRLELDLKEEKLASLQRELEEMTFGGGTEEEVAQLRRSKNEMDRRIKEQEEELDEMAGQVQLLEQAKLRLEMTLETMRKEARREAQQRDDELEEARGSAYKKIKALECQLETEHEERTLLLREKHELERRLSSMEDQDRVDRQTEEAANQKLRRDLRKYKALLKDAHAQLDRLKADSPGKTLIRQLRNQLEDAESARTLAMKARQTAEAELSEMQLMFEEAQRARNDAEDKSTAAHRDRAELQAQIEENEEELAELMKKYSATVKQLNTEQIAVSEYEFRISELEAERNNLKDQVGELQTRLENIENMSDPSAAVLSKRLELRAKELESRMELEQATRARLEVQVNRHKEALEKVQNEVAQVKMRELTAQDALKKSQKSLRELREEFHIISGREQESITRRKDLEKKLEQAEAEAASLRNDLRLALQRIADLQQAMEEGDDDVSESEESESTDGSLSDLEERLRPIQVKRTSLASIKETNGLTGNGDDPSLVIREKKSENSPRITAVGGAAAPTVSAAITTSTSLNLKMTSDGGGGGNGTNGGSDSLKNGDSSYA